MINSKNPNYDIFMDINIIKRWTAVDILGRHVKGHEDDNQSRHRLDQWANMNIWCGGKAKETLYRKYKDKEVPVTGWQLSIDNNLITAEWEMRIREHYAEKDIKNTDIQMDSFIKTVGRKSIGIQNSP